MQASPQGIAALNPMMGRNIPQPPQMPPQMPQGMGPSRAGLGDVEDRVDMYRANPDALQQQYAVSQDMLDLLALQQIKSEKEAAMRNMQLQMAQQSGQQPTVAQQREQEVMEMTKQDLAQQVGAVGQQQEQQRQQALQELMSGIAQAPGAANVMPMAGGGIIAFQDRGAVPYPVAPQVQSDYGYTRLKKEAEKLGIPFSIYMPREEYAETKRRLTEYIRTGKLPDAEPKPEPGPREAGATPEEMAGAPMVPPDTSGGVMGVLRRGAEAVRSGVSEAGEAVKRGVMGERPSFYSEELGYQPPPPPPAPAPQINQAELDRVKQMTQQGPQFDIRNPASAIPQLEAQLGRVGPSERAGIQRQIDLLRQRMAAQPAAAPAAPPAEMPAAPAAPQGIAGIPTSDFGAQLKPQILAEIGRNREQEEAARRKEAEDYMRDVLAKQRAVREQGIASERQRMEQEYDPERLRRERLKAFLLGPPGHDLASTLAGGAQSSMAYMQQQAAQQRARQQALQKAEEELAGMDVTQRGKYFDAGSAARAAVEQARKEGLERGASVYGAEMQAATAEANRRATEALRNLPTTEQQMAKRVMDDWLAKNPGKTLADAWDWYRGAGKGLEGRAEALREKNEIARRKLAADNPMYQMLQMRYSKEQDPAKKQQILNQIKDIERLNGIVEEGSASSQQQPIYAVNPQTKERIMSTDGGQTWKPVK